MKKTLLFLTSAVLLWGVNLETKTLESRCENKETKSCFELGNKFGESKNYQKAGEFYKKACELKHAGACSNVGVLYDMDYIKDVNNKNAAKFYQKGCELNDGFGCARLGFVYTLDKNYQKSKELFLIACELKDGDGYYGLGLLYYDGNGVEQDAKKAKELFEKSCDLGHAAGCNSLGMMCFIAGNT